MSDVIVVEPTVYKIDVVLPAYQVDVSAPGPQGIPGPEGPPGINTGYFTFEQVAPASTWTINHNLGYNPAVTATDTSGNVIEGTLLYITPNTLELSFGIAIAGNAYMS